MAQHSNYAKDRDLMMEAYASVEGVEVPKTSSSAMPRMLNESSCNSEHEEHKHEDAETESNVTFDHSVVFQLEGPLSMGVTPLERDVDEASAGLADRKETEEANGMVLVSDEDGKCILFYNGEELDQDGLEAAVKSFHDAEDAEGEHAGYSVGDIINGYDGEEIVTAVEADGTIFTRELGDGGNKYTPEEINNLPEDGEHAHKAEDGE